MKLDYNLIKTILEYVEEKTNGTTNFIFQDEQLQEITTESSSEAIGYHLNLLTEERFIKGQIGMDSYVIIDLHLSGHQLLEAMRNDTLWNKIKAGFKAAGIESLKQIPGLAIQLLGQSK